MRSNGAHDAGRRRGHLRGGGGRGTDGPRRRSSGIGRRGLLLRFGILVALVPVAVQRHASALEPPRIHGEADDIVAAFPESGILEDRCRLTLKASWSPARWLHLKASGYGELLARGRVEDGSASNLRLHETYVEIRGDFVEIRAGYSNVVWGVLDEIQPNDVVNPIDVSWFFFEGRGKARLPIPLVRTRLFLPAGIDIEVVAVPFHEEGVFDQLNEETSPFNISGEEIPVDLPIVDDPPPKTLREAEWGGRISRTVGRVDIGLYAYRGREDFPVYTIPALSHPTFPPDLRIVGHYPRFTLFGAGIETVIGKWGLRSEGTYLPEDSFQHPVGYEIVEGRSYQIGVGFDRTVRDDYLLDASAVYQRRIAEDDFIESARELSLVGGIERSFRHDLDKIRLFTVYNPIEGTVFLRLGGSRNVHRNLWLDLSSGIFIGDGNDLVGRFETADFVFLRGTYYF